MERVPPEKCFHCGLSKRQFEMLKIKVEESKQRITLMESEFLQSTLYTENELDDTQNEMHKLHSKYERLEQSHRELHEVNSDLEERILDICAAYEKEKQALNREVVSISQKLLDAKFEINKLEEKNTRLRKDCEIATQLLQCTPSSSYAQHKISNLPHDVQYHVHKIMGEMAKSGDKSALNSSSNQSPTSTSGNPGYITVSNENNQPLLNSDSGLSNGFLAGRVYDSVPAIIIAKAMQRRDEEEKKEMEKLFPKMRRSKIEMASGEIHDKGTQTYQPYRSSLLCQKCGESISKNKPVEPNEVNLLDLTEVTPEKAPPAKERTNSSLIADLLVEFEEQAKVDVNSNGTKPVESSVELLSILDTQTVTEQEEDITQPVSDGKLTKTEVDMFMDAEEEKTGLSRSSSSTSLQSSASRSSEATSVQSLPTEPVSNRPQKVPSSTSLPGSPSRRVIPHKPRSEALKQNGILPKEKIQERMNSRSQTSHSTNKVNKITDSTQEEIPIKNDENDIVTKTKPQKQKIAPLSPVRGTPDGIASNNQKALERAPGDVAKSVTPQQVFQQTSV
ncbi:uncharacterized protein [Antedon mediterranea]|uniref:uncharacterized protein n=1 Tax=Antedon mediterranea TaxID=105859 RepID=UPI003AF8A9C2